MNRRAFVTTSAGLLVSTAGLKAESNTWKDKVDPVILGDLEARFSGLLKNFAGGQLVGGDILIAAHSLQLWSAHLQHIGAVPDITAALQPQFRSPLSSTAMNQIRTLTYQIATGPRIEAALNGLQQANTPANMQKIRQILDNSGVAGMHAAMSQNMTTFAAKVQSNGGSLQVNNRDLYGGARLVQIQASSFCDAVAISGLYAAVWAYMGWAGYAVLAAMMSSGAAVAIGVVIAAMGVYCIGM
jgi:hypothetical protein